MAFDSLSEELMARYSVELEQAHHILDDALVQEELPELSCDATCSMEPWAPEVDPMIYARFSTLRAVLQVQEVAAFLFKDVDVSEFLGKHMPVCFELVENEGPSIEILGWDTYSRLMGEDTCCFEVRLAPLLALPDAEQVLPEPLLGDEADHEVLNDQQQWLDEA